MSAATSSTAPSSRAVGLGGFEEKFRAANRTADDGRLELDVGGTFAVEEENGTERNAEATLLGVARRLNLQRRAFAEAEDAAIGELHGSAALSAGAEAIARFESEAVGGGIPFHATGDLELDVAGDFHDATGRAVGLSGLSGRSNPDQEQQQNGEAGPAHRRTVPERSARLNLELSHGALPASEVHHERGFAPRTRNAPPLRRDGPRGH